MRFIKKISIAGATVLTVLGMAAGVAFAANSDSVVSGTTDHSIYKAGRTITITGTVNGDIFCAGETVNIDATVNGDIMCAAQTIVIDGKVNGSVRAAGQTVDIGAHVGRSATVAAQDATFQSNAVVGSDVGVAAQTATIDSLVGRDVRAAGHTLVLNSSINRNVDANVGKLELNGKASLGGNLVYTSPNIYHKTAGATIAGRISYSKPAVKRHNWAWGRILVAKSVFVSLALLVFSMVMVALFPRLIADWNKRSATQPWAPLLTGFIAMFMVPALTIALAITILGLPLAVFVIMAWVLVWLLAAPISAFYIGSLVLRNEKRAPLIMLSGGVILAIVCAIPILGWIISFLAAWFGTGSLLMNLRPLYKKPQYRI